MNLQTSELRFLFMKTWHIGRTVSGWGCTKGVCVCACHFRGPRSMSISESFLQASKVPLASAWDWLELPVLLCGCSSEQTTHCAHTSTIDALADRIIIAKSKKPDSFDNILDGCFDYCLLFISRLYDIKSWAQQIVLAKLLLDLEQFFIAAVEERTNWTCLPLIYARVLYSKQSQLTFENGLWQTRSRAQ